MSDNLNSLDDLGQDNNFEENRNSLLGGNEEETILENNDNVVMKKMITMISTNKPDIETINTDRKSILSIDTKNQEIRDDSDNNNSVQVKKDKDILELEINKKSENIIILSQDENRKNSSKNGSDDVNFVTEEDVKVIKESQNVSSVQMNQKTKYNNKNSVELEQDINLSFNICLIGETCVGKTSIITSFCDHVFKEDTSSTIGVDFRIMNVEYDNKKFCRLSIWDTAGQERFKSITYTYLKKAHGFMFVYDVTNRKSFQNLDTWIQIVNNNSLDSKIISVLVGNKSDKESQREIDTDFARKFAELNGMLFIETSAKNFSNVQIAFELLTKELANEFANKIDYQYEVQKNNSNKRMSVGYLIDPKIKIKTVVEKEDKCC